MTVMLDRRLPAALQTPRAAYVHVPFCAHRCGYCDFTLVAHRDDLIPAYLEALERELAQLAGPHPVDTLFFGGGTPTHLPAADLSRLLDGVLRTFELAPGHELSVEANPSGLDDEKLVVLKEHGVNRISLGVQSFDDARLKLLERDHSGDEALQALARVRSRFDNVSLDLIFGCPGQTLADWRADLARAISLEPTHIATYGLTYEKGTSFWGRRLRGQLASPGEEIERDMYAAAMDDLGAAGFVHYELSNFCQPGGACRHNEVYWAAHPYFGVGPGAARYVAGRRSMNHRSTTTWLQRVLAGADPTASFEELSIEERAREAIALGLRRRRGVDRAEFFETTGCTLDALAADSLRKQLRRGWMTDNGLSVALTREGCFVADTVVSEFL